MSNLSSEQELMSLFWKMHEDGALRECASTQVCQQCFSVNGGNTAQAIVGAIMTFGGAHAPLALTGQLFNKAIRLPVEDLRGLVVEIAALGKVPGFGSGFVKGEPDDIHAEIDRRIKELAPKHHFYLVELTHHVQEVTHKNIWPNTAMYSALVANILNIPSIFIPGLAIEARVHVWNVKMREFYERTKK